MRTSCRNPFVTFCRYPWATDALTFSRLSRPSQDGYSCQNSVPEEMSDATPGRCPLCDTAILEGAWVHHYRSADIGFRNRGDHRHFHFGACGVAEVVAGGQTGRTVPHCERR